MHQELEFQKDIKRHGIVLGTPVPKNIPFKQADIRQSFDLEHMQKEEFRKLGKNNEIKKVYLELHQIVKGDLEFEATDPVGPREVPGQEIERHNFKGHDLSYKGHVSKKIEDKAPRKKKNRKKKNRNENTTNNDVTQYAEEIDRLRRDIE